MEDEEGGETPAGNPDSKPFATTPRTPLPAQGVSKQLATDVHWVTHATFWSQIGLGLIGIVALVIYYCQLRQMSKATKATQDAVCVASRTLAETVRSNKAQEALSSQSLNATLDNFRQEQRAWISVKDPQIVPSGILVRLENTGHTPAIDVAIQCCFIVERNIFGAAPTLEEMARLAAKRSSKIPDADAQVIATFRAHAKDSPQALRAYQDRLKLSNDWKRDHPVRKKHGVIGPNAAPMYVAPGGGGPPTADDKAFFSVGEITYNDIYTKKLRHTSICIVNAKLGLGMCGDGQKMD